MCHLIITLVCDTSADVVLIELLNDAVKFVNTLSCFYDLSLYRLELFLVLITLLGTSLLIEHLGIFSCKLGYPAYLLKNDLLKCHSVDLMCRASVLALPLIISATVIVFFGAHCFCSVQIHAITATRTGDYIVEDIYLARLIGTIATIKDQLNRFKIRFADESFVRVLEYQPFFLGQAYLLFDLE